MKVPAAKPTFYPNVLYLVVLERKINQLIIHMLFSICGKQNFRGYLPLYTQHRMDLEVYFLSSIPGMHTVGDEN